MSNLEEHEAEQARINAECAAGECDHPECYETTIHCEPNGEQYMPPGNIFGLACPTCGADHDINVTFTGTAKLTESGTVDDGAHEWDSKSPAFCGACGFNGLAEDFSKPEPEPYTFKINLAQNIRAYGYVTVTAPSLAEAVAQVDHAYIFEHFEPHGSGADDFNYANATAAALTEAEDEEGNTEALDIELPDAPTEERQRIDRALWYLRALDQDADIGMEPAEIVAKIIKELTE
jgi:hypothetical protein